ncbi:hypothetical protein BS78_03G093000 [Paspalum vaginatum]|nr:hypothetical protein BS78_03G093000 [Paspalum vaginatum]
MTAKRGSRLRLMCVITIILAAVIISCPIVVDSLEVQGGGTVRHMCLDPEPECRHPGAPPPPPVVPPHHWKMGRSLVGT